MIADIYQRDPISYSHSCQQFQIDNDARFDRLEKVSGCLFMVTEEQKKYKVVTIKNELGLHARSAAQIANIAVNSTANVWLKKDDKIADASSIIDILILACEKGTKITIIIENWADINILNAIVDLVDSGFGE